MYYNRFMKERLAPSDYFTAGSRGRNPSTSHLISIRLADDLIQRLAAIGNDEGLAMSDTIRLVLERGLATSKRKKTT